MEARVPRFCPECGKSDALAAAVSEGGMTLQCPECGAEFEADI